MIALDWDKGTEQVIILVRIRTKAIWILYYFDSSKMGLKNRAIRIFLLGVSEVVFILLSLITGSLAPTQLHYVVQLLKMQISTCKSVLSGRWLCWLSTSRWYSYLCSFPFGWKNSICKCFWFMGLFAFFALFVIFSPFKKGNNWMHESDFYCTWLQLLSSERLLYGL